MPRLDDKAVIEEVNLCNLQVNKCIITVKHLVVLQSVPNYIKHASSEITYTVFFFHYWFTIRFYPKVVYLQGFFALG